MEDALKQIEDKTASLKKVVLFGPESTGKSTLAKELAKYYNTVYVEEFSRHYAEIKAQENKALTRYDVLPIAVGQMLWEHQQQLKANKLLICDTDLLETKVYSEFYYNGFCPGLVQKYALENTYDLYFLTYIDTPWEADTIRDQPNSRLDMFTAFEQALIDSKKRYIVVKGSLEERLNICITQINKLLNN